MTQIYLIGLWAALGFIAGGALARHAPALLHLRLPRSKARTWILSVAAAAAFGLIQARLGPTFAAARVVVLAALLVTLTATDLAAKLIPDVVTLPGAAVGLLLGVSLPHEICGLPHGAALLAWIGLAPGPIGAAVLSVGGAAVGFAVLEALRRGFGRIAGMEVMGMGDSKLLAMAGTFLGPEMALLALLPAIVFGLVFGVVYTRLLRQPHFPFGPALAFGALTAALYPAFLADTILLLPRSFARLGPRLNLAVLAILLSALALLLLRVRRRARDYQRMIDEDYARIEKDEERGAP